jgi:glycosyltransferase involved in cell wall biosynthesis
MNKAGQGGSEKYVYDIIKKYGPQYCVFVYSLDGPLVKQLEALGVTCYHVKMRHPFDMKAAIAISKIIKQENISLIHAHFLRENYIAILAKLLTRRIEVVWTYHVNVPMKRHIVLLNKIFTAFNKKVIAVSNFMKRELIKRGINPAKIQVIYNGIGLDHCCTTPGSKERTFVKMAIIGRLSSEKGHAFLLKSLYELKKLAPDAKWSLDIVGDGELLHDLKRLTKDLKLENYVHFLGYINNVIDYLLNNIDIVIIPSENEALSFAAIEAMATGKPIVCTNIGGLPEVVVDGENGFLVEYGDTEALAKKLSTLIHSAELRREFGDNGKKRFEKYFTFEAMYSQLLNIYNQ